MIYGRIRISDIPRVVGYFLLIFPALFWSAPSDEEDVPWPIKYVILGIVGALGGPFFFYDYRFMHHYMPAILISWFATADLLGVAFERLMNGDTTTLILFGGVFGSLLTGTFVFCGIRTLIDWTNGRDTEHLLSENPDHDDDYTVPKTLGSAGAWFFGFGLFFLIMDMGVSGNDSQLPDGYYYLLSAGIGFFSAVLISYHKYDWLAYLVAMPMGGTIALACAGNELRREDDVSGLFILILILGMIPGCGIFFAIKKYCLPQQFSQATRQRWARIATEDDGLEMNPHQPNRNQYEDFSESLQEDSSAEQQAKVVQVEPNDVQVMNDDDGSHTNVPIPKA